MAAQHEAERQEQQLRRRHALSGWLLFGGAAVAMVAATLLSARLTRRYRRQQVREFIAAVRRQAQEVRDELHSGKLRQRVQELERRCAQWAAQLEALEAYERLDRWLPPPVRRDKFQEVLRTLHAITCASAIRIDGDKLLWAQLEEDLLWRAEAEAARRRGSDAGGPEGAEAQRGRGEAGEGGTSGASGTGSGDEAEPSPRRRKQRSRQRGRQNAAEPVLRAVHGLVRALRRE